MSFSKILRDWYSENKRILPWRKTKNPYFVWLSEIILQQTQVKQGLPYYEKFVNRFPSIDQLANASEEEVLKLWQGLGYYSRARNLHSTAKIIIDKHSGKFPKSYKELLGLRGIGDYTASAISSICFNQPHAVVDGNVYRVLGRHYGIDLPINSSGGIKHFKNIAQEVLDIKSPGDHNQAIMEFGAVHCTPKNPNCQNCPFQQTCVAWATNKVSELPVKLKKTKVRHRYFNYLFINNGTEVAWEQRKGDGIWKNLYQLPLIETDEPVASDSSALHEHLNELVKQPYKIELFNEKDVVHKLSHQHLHTKFWIVTAQKILTETANIRDITNYPVPVLISNFLEEYRSEY